MVVVAQVSTTTRNGGGAQGVRQIWLLWVTSGGCGGGGVFVSWIEA